MEHQPAGTSCDVYKTDCIDHLGKLNLLPLPKIGEKLKITITEVYDPSHYWLNIISESHNHQLNNLMVDMNTFYKSTENVYAMPLPFIKAGQFCAALHMGEFSRARILNLIDNQNVEVHHVDRGTNTISNVRDIRQLPHKFCELPMQAVRGRLALVIPWKLKWFSYSGAALRKLVENKNIQAEIFAIDEIERALSLKLVNLMENKNVSINQVMVNQGHGFNLPQTWRFNIPEDFLLPSFQELENGNQELDNTQSSLDLLFHPLGRLLILAERTKIPTWYLLQQAYGNRSKLFKSDGFVSGYQSLPNTYINAKYNVLESGISKIITFQPNATIKLFDYHESGDQQVGIWTFDYEDENGQKISKNAVIVEEIGYMFPFMSIHFLAYIYNNFKMLNLLCAYNPSEIIKIKRSLKVKKALGRPGEFQISVMKIDDEPIEQDVYILFIPIEMLNEILSPFYQSFSKQINKNTEVTKMIEMKYSNIS